MPNNAKVRRREKRPNLGLQEVLKLGKWLRMAEHGVIGSAKHFGPG